MALRPALYSAPCGFTEVCRLPSIALLDRLVVSRDRVSSNVLNALRHQGGCHNPESAIPNPVRHHNARQIRETANTRGGVALRLTLCPMPCGSAKPAQSKADNPTDEIRCGIKLRLAHRRPSLREGTSSIVQPRRHPKGWQASAGARSAHQVRHTPPPTVQCSSLEASDSSLWLRVPGRHAGWSTADGGPARAGC